MNEKKKLKMKKKVLSSEEEIEVVWNHQVYRYEILNHLHRNPKSPTSLRSPESIPEIIPNPVIHRHLPKSIVIMLNYHQSHNPKLNTIPIPKVNSEIIPNPVIHRHLSNSIVIILNYHQISQFETQHHSDPRNHLRQPNHYQLLIHRHHKQVILHQLSSIKTNSKSNIISNSESHLHHSESSPVY